MKKNERLLREYVKTILKEEDFVSGMDSNGGGYDPQSRDVHGAISFGSGKDLLGVFGIKGIINAGQVALGSVKEIARRGLTLVPVLFGIITTIVFPWIGVNYAGIFEREKQDVDKIRAQYKPANDAVNALFGNADVKMLTFMASPGTLIAAQTAILAPKATKMLLSAVSGGYSDKLFSAGISNALLGSEKNNSNSKKEEARAYRKSFLFELNDENLNIDNKERSLLSDPTFIAKCLQSKTSISDEMKKNARAVINSTLQEVIDEATDVIKNSNTLDAVINSLKKYSENKQVPKEMSEQLDNLKKLPQSDRTVAERSLLSQIKKSMKEIYIKGLESRIKESLDIDKNGEGFFVAAYKEAIDMIKSL
jgi:hypothetical protein